MKPHLLIKILVLIGLLYLFKSKKQSIETIKNYIFKNKISDEEFRIINFLINKYPKELTFPEILNFYEENLSYESRIKNLRLSLSHIDYIIKTSTKNKIKLIYSRNKNDKRIKQVKLSLSY